MRSSVLSRSDKDACFAQVLRHFACSLCRGQSFQLCLRSAADRLPSGQPFQLRLGNHPPRASAVLCGARARVHSLLCQSLRIFRSLQSFFEPFLLFAMRSPWWLQISRSPLLRSPSSPYGLTHRPIRANAVLFFYARARVQFSSFFPNILTLSPWSASCEFLNRFESIAVRGTSRKIYLFKYSKT